MDVEYLKKNWNTQKVSVLAAHLGVPEPAVRRIAIKLGLGPRTLRSEAQEPSQSEIRARAAEVRARWSPEERERRFVGRRKDESKRWTVPVIRMLEVEAPSYSRI